MSAPIVARCSGASHIRVDDDHPVDWIRGRKTIEFVVDDLPDPLVMGGTFHLIQIDDPIVYKGELQ